jgi:hypothetical protein
LHRYLTSVKSKYKTSKRLLTGDCSLVTSQSVWNFVCDIANGIKHEMPSGEYQKKKRFIAVNVLLIVAVLSGVLQHKLAVNKSCYLFPANYGCLEHTVAPL